MKASYTNGSFRGRKINPGQVVIGLIKTSSDTGLSIQSIRTALNHLKSTNEITIESTNKFSIVTVLNYSTYQNQEEIDNNQNNKEINKPSTNHQQTTNNVQEVKKVRSKEERPTLPILQDFFKDNIMAANFLDYYQSNGWKVGKNPMKDWKSAASGWKRRQGQFTNTTNAGWIKP